MACDFARQAAARAFSRRNPGTETYSIVGLHCCKFLRSSLFILDFTFLGYGCCDRLSSLARVVTTLAFVVLRHLVLWRLGLRAASIQTGLAHDFPSSWKVGLGVVIGYHR